MFSPLVSSAIKLFLISAAASRSGPIGTFPLLPCPMLGEGLARTDRSVYQALRSGHKPLAQNNCSHERHSIHDMLVHHGVGGVGGISR